MGLMTDDRFEQWLRETAQDYHRPPSVTPRAEMWRAVAARRVGHHPAHARRAGGERRPARGPARGLGVPTRPDRAATGGCRSRGRAVDQSGIGTTKRIAATPDGEPGRSRRTRARSAVML